MIPIGEQTDDLIRVLADIKRDRVLIELPPGGRHAIWLTQGEATVLAENLMRAAREIRLRREEKG